MMHGARAITPRRRSVLDLSAGCGLVGLAAARLGAQRTVLTDLAPNLALLRRNADKNGKGRVHPRGEWDHHVA